MFLQQRSYKKELLDGDAIPFKDIERNMHELNVINTCLGGHRITVNGLKRLLEDQTFSKPFVVVEIGCGGGDNLRVLKRWAQKKQNSCKSSKTPLTQTSL